MRKIFLWGGKVDFSFLRRNGGGTFRLQFWNLHKIWNQDSIDLNSVWFGQRCNIGWVLLADRNGVKKDEERGIAAASVSAVGPILHGHWQKQKSPKNTCSHVVFVKYLVWILNKKNACDFNQSFIRLQSFWCIICNQDSNIKLALSWTMLYTSIASPLSEFAMHDKSSNFCVKTFINNAIAYRATQQGRRRRSKNTKGVGE